MNKTSGNWIYIENLYFPCHVVNAFRLAVLYNWSSFFSDRPEIHKPGRAWWDLPSYHLSLNSVQRCQRRSKMSQRIEGQGGHFFRSAKKSTHTNTHAWWSTLRSCILSSFVEVDTTVSEEKEKKKEIWPSPMTKPPIPTENSKTKGQHTQTPPKTSITQRLRTDLGRSVGVTSNPTGVVKPVYGIPTFPLTAKAV